MMWHFEMVPKKTKKALDILSECAWLDTADWYLAGGTALTLATGHRLSVDLDFFTPVRDFDTEALQRNLMLFGHEWRATSEQPGTLFGELFGAKVSFIAYPFFRAEEQFKKLGTIRVLDPKDIAVMKILALSQRGKKRDFFDMYWYVKNRESLTAVIGRLKKQFPEAVHDYNHIAAALVYFADAEEDPDPIITFNASWKQVKNFFEKEVPRVTKEILQLED